MTQYHYDRPPTTAVETAVGADRIQDRVLKSLQDRIAAQDQELQELRRTVRRLQNEVRSAVNAFNLRNHG
jgi:peptidoglycan hydrolase CwlO-like protein